MSSTSTLPQPPTFPQPTSSSSLNYYISPENRTPAVLVAWHWILISGGQILLPFLLATMILSRNVRRDPTLVNMIVTWILFTVMLSLLYYTGHDRGPEPPFGLCIAQASLLSGAPVMSTAAGLALVLQMFLGLRNLVRKVSTAGKMTTKDERRYKLDTRWRARALVSVPYILFFIFAITSLIIGLRDRSIVNRKRAWLFCSVNGPIVIAVSVASAVLAAITLILEIWIAVIFYKHGTEVASTKTESAFNVRLIIRVMVLSVYSALCWISFVVIRTKWDVVPWILTATVPLVAFVIFGSQKSVLRVWMFWVPRKPRVEMEPPSPMTPGVIYDPRKAPFGGIKMASFDQGSRPIIVTLPPRAHTPALGERKEPSFDRDGMVNVDLGAANVKGSVDERRSDVEDVYGWEREYVRAATPAAV